MLRGALPILVLLVSCSKGPEADLASIGEARSLTAEWALVNEQSSEGKLTEAYTRTMQQELREQLRSAESSLTQPRSAYAGEMRAILAGPDDASPQSLRAHAAKLKQVEDSLESA